MKNLLFKVTLTILVSFLIGIQTTNAQTTNAQITNAQTTNTKPRNTTHFQIVTGYFTMTISAGYADQTTQCFVIELTDFNLLDSNDTVQIMDKQGNEYTCDINQASCIVEWCYEKEVVEQHEFIECLVIDGGTGSLLLRDGCVIIIDPL